MVSKKNLLLLCKTLGITRVSNKNKKKLKELISDYEDSKQTKVIATGKNIKYIYHSADIHIRTLERHQEYLDVFNNLYDYISNQENLDESVFVICGDIFHNRDRLISETILLFNTFIEKLSSVIDIILIVGNHDTFTHTDRLDTITGIVNIKAYNNFHFLKWSGIYRYHNINFVVSSLLDNKFIRSNEVEDVENVFKISLYHGPLSGSKLDNNYDLPDNTGTLKTSDFKGYDFVLLGDIHKKQWLNKTTAYPGSLIQQNHKEERLHGIIKWNLYTSESDFIPIHNDYGYITLYIKNNKYDSNIDFPMKSRIKLVHNYDENISFEELKKNISIKTNIISITKEIDINKLSTDNTDKCISYSREDVDKQIFTKLISKYNNETQNKLTNIHTNFLKDIDITSNTYSNNVWEIKNLEFTNVFIYGDDYINKINFCNKQGIIGILGNNAIGKSSIFNIIIYTLFGNVTKNKNYMNRNIINKNSKFFNIKMTIQMGTTEYIIKREGKNKSRKNGSKSMDEVLTFTSISDDNITTNLTDTNKIVTSDKIKETFGLSDRDLFNLTNVMSYSNYVSILNMSNSEISNTFSKLFNLEKYKIIYSMAHNSFKNISDSIKVKQGELNSFSNNVSPINYEDVNDLKHDLDICIAELDINSKKLEKIIKEEAQISCDTSIIRPDTELTVSELLEQLKVLPTTKMTINELNTHIIPLEKLIDRNNIIYTNTPEDELLLQKENILASFIKTISPCTVKEFNKANEYINSFDFFDQDIINTLINNVSKNNLNKPMKTQLLSILNTISNNDLLNKYVETKTILQEYKKYKNNIIENKNLENSLDNINGQLNYIYNNTLIKLYDMKKYIHLNNILVSLEKYNENEHNLIVKHDLIKTKKSLQSEKISLEKEKNIILKELTELNLMIKQQETLAIKIKDLQTILKDFEYDEYIYKIYKTIVNDRSLPKVILSNTIKQIETEANNLIYRLAGLFVIIDNSLEEDSKWDILIKKNDIFLGTEHVSGYERFIINIGLKLALDKYKSYPGTRLFFIDEAFDCISEENLDKIDELFIYLKNYYKNIIIISHNEELKKKIDHLIKIDTDFSSSKIL